MTLQTLNVLLVDDDAEYLFLVAQAFKKAPADFLLRVVSDGLAARDYIEGSGKYSDRAFYPLPDLILLDLNMPQWNGLQFLEWLRQKASDDRRLTPTILMSSACDDQTVKRAYALGVNSCSAKPVHWADFESRIKSLGDYWANHSVIPHEQRA